MEHLCAKATLNSDTYTTSIEARHHQLIADEPAELGGEDKGMSPEEMLCGALAACTAITLKMYAGRKEWPLTGIEVKVDHIDAKKRTDKENSEAGLFVRHVDLQGDLSDEQKGRMIQIANKCPVHKTLSRGADIDTRLAVCGRL